MVIHLGAFVNKWNPLQKILGTVYWRNRFTTKIEKKIIRGATSDANIQLLLPSINITENTKTQI